MSKKGAKEIQVSKMFDGKLTGDSSIVTENNNKDNRQLESLTMDDA